MRDLSATLLAAQRKATFTPYVKVEAFNKIAGVVRLDWTRLYEGSEDDYYHAMTMPGDGSLIRARITPPADSRKLYRSRVADPNPQSDFSQWTYTNQYDVYRVACCALGAEVSLFWINGSRQIYQQKSTDWGISWGSPSLIDYSPSTAVYGAAAFYKPNGDIALFFADQATLYVKKYLNGQWQAKSAWDRSSDDLSGVAVVYDNDWNLLLSGKDENGNFKLWSIIYGDGGEVSLGTWSELKELVSAPADGNFEYRNPFMDKPDIYRGFFAEKFTGTEAYSRPFWSHSTLTSKFIHNLWREPVPFNLSSEYGVAIAHYGDYCWLSSASGVWRAELSEKSLNLTPDVLSLRLELTHSGKGRLIVELRNDDGRYTSPGEGDLKALDLGCEIAVSPGYTTSEGNETSPGLAFWLDGYEHTSSSGKASLVLYASDGWGLLQNWRARHQLRWNKATDEKCVKDILTLVLARVGLKLEVKSESSTVTSYYPDFTIHLNNHSEAVIRKLLSFVPDELFCEGNKAHLVNPQSADNSVYSYGSSHLLLEGRYQKGAWGLNRVQVEGYDPQNDKPIIVDRFSWPQIAKLQDRLRQLEDQNIDTTQKAGERGEAYLREAEIEATSGVILVPVNCGQQLYDVIDITDSRSGLNAEKRRVLGLTLIYNPSQGEYEERLFLGAV